MRRREGSYICESIPGMILNPAPGRYDDVTRRRTHKKPQEIPYP